MDIGRPYILQRAAPGHIPDVTLVLEKQLGAGAQATIYKGTMTNLGDVVIRRIKADSPGVRASIDAEIASLRNTRLSAKENRRNASNTEGCNPYINCYYGMITSVRPATPQPFVYVCDELPADYVHLIYEYIPGTTLRELLLSPAPLSADMVKRYGHQLLLGVTAMHAHNIVHLDLKPDNIMITPDNQLKIIDFGLAKPATGPTQIAGFTPEYLAPEGWIFSILAQSPFARDVRSQVVKLKELDMFAVGCILYELCANKKLLSTLGESMSYASSDHIDFPTGGPFTVYLPLLKALLSSNKTLLDDYSIIAGIADIKGYIPLLKRRKDELTAEIERVEAGGAPSDDLKARLETLNAESNAILRMIRIHTQFARDRTTYSNGKGRPSAEAALAAWCEVSGIDSCGAASIAGGARRRTLRRRRRVSTLVHSK